MTIEKHGRAVAVVISKEEFDDIETMKLELLRSDVEKGIVASAAGDILDIAEEDLDQFVDRIMSGEAVPRTDQE